MIKKSLSNIVRGGLILAMLGGASGCLNATGRANVNSLGQHLLVEYLGQKARNFADNQDYGNENNSMQFAQENNEQDVWIRQDYYDENGNKVSSYLGKIKEGYQSFAQKNKEKLKLDSGEYWLKLYKSHDHSEALHSKREMGKTYIIIK